MRRRADCSGIPQLGTVGRAIQWKFLTLVNGVLVEIATEAAHIACCYSIVDVDVQSIDPRWKRDCVMDNINVGPRRERNLQQNRSPSTHFN